MRLIWAFMLAVLACVAPSIKLAKSAGADPAFFSDWDEPYYFPLLEEGAGVPLAALASLENGNLKAYSDLKTRLPHRVADVIVGKIYKSLGVPLTTFAVILDFLCVFSSFLILYSIVSLLTPRALYAIAASIAVLFLPWVLAFVSEMTSPAFIGSRISTLSHSGFPSTAALRGVYTQVSFPLFLLGFYFTLRSVLSDRNRFAWTIAAGAAAGILGYVYFFSWLASIAVSSLLLALHFIFREISARMYARQLLALLIPFGILSLPTIKLLTGESGIYAPGPIDQSATAARADFFRSIWFLNPTELLFCVLLGAALVKRQRWAKMPTERLLLLVLIALLLAKVCLMNSQPVLGRWLTPYHFPLFYLDPLATGFALLLAFRFFEGGFLSRVLPITAIIVATAPIVMRTFESIRTTSSISEEQELIAYLQSEKNRLYVATMPFSDPFKPDAKLDYMLLPYWIKAMTKHDSVAQFMSFSEDRISLIRLELLLSWLYGGKLALIAPCPPSIAAVSRADLLIGARAFHQWQRYFDCQTAAQLRHDLCDLLKSFYVDRLVLERGQTSLRAPFLTPIWSSSKRRYTIATFDQRAAMQECL